MSLSTHIRAPCTALLIAISAAAGAQSSPLDPAWSVYASGIGQRLTPGMDPCWITYTVGLPGDPTIARNVAAGLMGEVGSGLNWHQASALKRRYGRYFDDQPDGTYKLSPCDSADLEGNQGPDRHPPGGGGDKACACECDAAVHPCADRNAPVEATWGFYQVGMGAGGSTVEKGGVICLSDYRYQTYSPQAFVGFQCDKQWRNCQQSWTTPVEKIKYHDDGAASYYYHSRGYKYATRRPQR